MRFTRLPLAKAVILLFAVVLPCRATDWKKFEDPIANLLTDEFAESIRALPAPERAAAVKRLKNSLTSDLVEIRRRSALTLHALGDKSGVPTMIADLSIATERDRDNVAVALRVMKGERAIPALREALKDKSPYVRGIAAEALGEVKAAKAYDDLIKLTKDKVLQKGICVPMCPAHSACYALGALGDQRAVPVLIGLLDDKDLRSSACQALEGLTKQKLGYEVEKWKAWFKSQGR